MGYLDRHQRRGVRKKFKVRTFYLCDVCEKPIPVGELIVIDPKKGYFPWPHHVPRAVRCLMGREPKWCCHYMCDPVRHRREQIAAKRKHRAEKLLKASNRVLEMIERKPKRGYWTKDKCVSKLEGEFERKLVLRSIKQLRKERRLKKRNGGYIARVK